VFVQYNVVTLLLLTAGTCQHFFPWLTQAFAATVGSGVALSAMAPVYRLLPLLVKVPLCFVGGTTYAYAYSFTALSSAYNNPGIVSWLCSDSTDVQTQRRARCIDTFAGYVAGQFAIPFIIWGSGGLCLVPVCIFYTAYTMGGTTSERARTKYI
jgi:hypothetical protein